MITLTDGDVQSGRVFIGDEKAIIGCARYNSMELFEVFFSSGTRLTVDRKSYEVVKFLIESRK